MTRKQKNIARVLLLTLAISVVIFINTRPEPIKVNIKTVEFGSVEKTAANTRAGTVKACHRAKLSPAMGGQIASLHVKEGDQVKKGDLLLEIWNKDLQAQLKLTQSEARSAAALVSAACLKSELLQREANRLTQLHKAGVISEDQLDSTNTQAKVGAADCRAAQVGTEVSLQRIRVAETLLMRTRLLAPFDGVIADISGELNEYATPSPPGIPTPPTIDLINSQCFYVIAPIDEVDAPDIRLNMPARIQLDAFRNRQFSGNVQRIGSYVLDVEKQARTIDVEIRFSNPEDFRPLLAGYSADAEIILQAHHKVLRIPTAAILNGNQVFVYHEQEKKLHVRTVKTGLTNWDFTEITAGLTQGEKVVTSNNWEGIAEDATVSATEAAP